MLHNPDMTEKKLLSDRLETEFRLLEDTGNRETGYMGICPLEFVNEFRTLLDHKLDPGKMAGEMEKLLRHAFHRGWEIATQLELYRNYCEQHDLYLPSDTRRRKEDE